MAETRLRGEVKLFVLNCVATSSNPARASIMSNDYDSLSAQEREVRDKEDRAREIVEQAGMISRFGAFRISRM